MPLVPLDRPPSRNLHVPAVPVQQQIQPRYGIRALEAPPHDLGDANQRPALIVRAAGSRAASSSRTWAAVSLHAPPPGLFDNKAARPRAASAHRHRFADIRVTRNCRPPLPSLALASISSRAANRTCSWRARSAAVSPPPSGYLMTTAIALRRALTGSVAPGLKDSARRGQEGPQGRSSIRATLLLAALSLTWVLLW